MAVYLDYAATTPQSPESLAAYCHAAQILGNPASVHRAGQLARDVLEEGRENFATAIHANPLEIVLNSGATEGNNHVLWHAVQQFPKGHIITSAVEHSAVLKPAQFWQSKGYDVTILTPDRFGGIHPEQVQAAIKANTVLVSIMHSNNEVGSIQNITQMASITRERGILLHTDAVQSLGVLPVDVQAWGVDFATFTAHKFFAPTGVGFLYVRRGLELTPLLMAGGQEKGWRGGTHNTPGVYAAGKAALQAVQQQPQHYAHMQHLKTTLQQELSVLPEVKFNHAPQSSPKILSLSVAGVDSEALLMNLDMAGLYVSTGSACSAGTMQASHVLLAMGLSPELAKSTLRFSLSHHNTLDDVLQAKDLLSRAISSSRI